MKAAVFNGSELEVKEVPDPKLLEEEVLIKIKYCGICGTDIAIVNGWYKVPTPLIIGHEFVGEVVKVANPRHSHLIGKDVACEINSKICGKCYYCVRGMPTHCVERKALGIDIDGGMAEYIAVPHYLIHMIPDSIKLEDATFIEPLAAAYQTFEMMPLPTPASQIATTKVNQSVGSVAVNLKQENAAVFGLGKLGLLIIQVAKQYGLNVIAVDRSEKKLNLAVKLGADYHVNPNKIDVVQKIKMITNGVGVDYAIDCTGNDEILQQVISSTRSRGKIHIKSTHGLPASINITELVVREISIHTSRCGPFEKAIKGLESKKISVSEILTHVFPLEQINKAFEILKEPSTIKVLIKISD